MGPGGSSLTIPRGDRDLNRPPIADYAGHTALNCSRNRFSALAAVHGVR